MKTLNVGETSEVLNYQELSSKYRGDKQMNEREKFIIARSYVLKGLLNYINTTKKLENKKILEEALSKILGNCKKDGPDNNPVNNIDKLKEYLSQLQNQINEDGVKSQRLSKLINYMLCQINNVDYLARIGDSEIIATKIGERVLKAGRPRHLSTAEFNMTMNLPNVYNNPAEPDAEHWLSNKDPEAFKELDAFKNSNPIKKLDAIDFNKLAIIYVTGGKANPYGHSILKLGDYGYIHINTLNDKPQFIRDDEHFAAYLRAQGGRVFYIHPLDNLKHPEAAKAMLAESVQQTWAWKMTHNNCLTFIHKIAFAGGVTPAQLGYATTDLHGVAKLPIEFATMQCKGGACGINLAAKSAASQKTYTNEVSGLFAKYIKDAQQIEPELKKQLIAYYVELRCNGLLKDDALQCTLIYGKFSGLELTTQGQHVRPRGNLVMQAFHNMKASAHAFFTKLSGDDRPALQKDPKPALVPEVRSKDDFAVTYHNREFSFHH